MKKEQVRLDSFILHSRIGKGSFGEVYLTERKDATRLYAMKILKKKNIFDNNLIQYALTERNVLSQFNHPFIVKLHTAFQNQKYLFLLLDYHPGGDLGEYLETE